MIRLAPLCAAMLALVACTPRTDLPGPLAIRASYEQLRTDCPTIPRCLHGLRPMGERYTADDAAAVRMLGIELTERTSCRARYTGPPAAISIEPWMPRAMLLHEVAHAGQIAGGHDGYWTDETGSMVVEVAALKAEGWSDDRIRALSPNNSQSPAWIFAWIRTYGPALTGTAADIPIVYAWGRSDESWAALTALIPADQRNRPPTNNGWANAGWNPGQFAGDL